MILLLVNFYIFAFTTGADGLSATGTMRNAPFHAADQAPLDNQWTRFTSYRRSQGTWKGMLISLGKCSGDPKLCFDSERIFMLDVPYGFEVKEIRGARVLCEVPLEWVEPKDQGRLRSYLFTQAGVPDSLFIRSENRSLALVKEK